MSIMDSMSKIIINVLKINIFPDNFLWLFEYFFRPKLAGGQEPIKNLNSKFSTKRISQLILDLFGFKSIIRILYVSTFFGSY